MSVCTLNNKLYLFGGSSYAAKCFNGLQVFFPEESIWVN